MKRQEQHEERLNYRAASVIAAIYNTVRDPKKRRKPFTADDILGKQPEKKQQTPQDMLETVKMLNKALGGKEVKR